MSKKSTEAGALAMANNIGDNPIKYADLTEVLNRLGAGCLTIIVGHVEAIIEAALPHLEIEAQQAYEAETLTTYLMGERIAALERALADREEQLRDLLLQDRAGEILSQNSFVHQHPRKTPA